MIENSKKFTLKPSFTNTNIKSQRGYKSEWEPAAASNRDWESSSLRTRPADRGPDALVREGGWGALVS